VNEKEGYSMWFLLDSPIGNKARLLNPFLPLPRLIPFRLVVESLFVQMKYPYPRPQILIAVLTAIALGFCHYGIAQDRDEDFDSDLLNTLDIIQDDDLEPGETGDHEWLVAPIPSRSAGLGWTLAVPAAVLYRPESSDPEDPAWITGVGGFYAENESWGAGLFHRMSLKDDSWRLQGVLLYSDVNYNVYGVGSGGGDPNVYFELGQKVYGGMAEGLRMIAPNLHFGLRTYIIKTEIHSISFPALQSPDLDLSLFGIQLNLYSLVPRLVYDTRDNEFYPHRGNLAHAEVKLDSESWGSDYDYQIYSADWNHYHGLTDNQVLAFRVAGKYAAGDLPFFLLPAMGSGSDLRGFKPGIYRDNALITGQMEYRIRFTERLGAVAFYGLGKIGPAWDDLGKTLDSGGIGLRWVVAKKNDVSFRLDVAWGEDEPEYYISLGEAF